MRFFSAMLACCVLAACSPDKTLETPEGVVEAFIKASRDGDEERMEKLVADPKTRDWQQFQNPFLDLTEEEKESVEIDMGDTRITDEKAVVEYKLRVGGKLKAYGVIVVLKDEYEWKVSREKSTVHIPEQTTPPS
jgi:hypothetical protein